MVGADLSSTYLFFIIIFEIWLYLLELLAEY